MGYSGKCPKEEPMRGHPKYPKLDGPQIEHPTEHNCIRR